MGSENSVRAPSTDNEGRIVQALTWECRDHCYVREQPNNTIVAEIDPFQDLTRKERAEVSRLIAAAPDLLEALKALLVAVTYSAPPVNFGTADDPNPGFEARVPVQFVDEAQAAVAKALSA